MAGASIMIPRLKASEVPAMRAAIAAAQGGLCAICGKKFYDKMPLDPVLDHDHRTGLIRGVLHRGCNSLLGNLENYAPRAWIKDLPRFAAGVEQYLLHLPAEQVLHHTHRTAVEKAERTKVRAKKRRATKKAA